MSLFHRMLSGSKSHRRQRRQPTARRGRDLASHRSLRLEALEQRSMLSVVTGASPQEAQHAADSVARVVSTDARILSRHVSLSSNPDAPNGPFAPADIRHAYGFDSLVLNGSITGDGSGQTIAIVDPYNDPNLNPNLSTNDLDTFDKSFSINGGSQSMYQQYGAASTFFSIAEPEGTPNDATKGTNGPAVEESLDVEWLHALAPKAHLILVEALSNTIVNANGSEGDMLNAVDWARTQSGVSVVSMSWGTSEFSTETNWDSHFTSPYSPGAGVTFLAATGDFGSPGDWPAYSPNVVAVGGTNLSIESAAGNYLGETGWSGSGGGTSQYEAEPSFQDGVQSTGKRTIPDVSANAGSGVWVYDSYDSPGAPWLTEGGTSFAVLVWGATTAIGDQGRANAGLLSIDGPGGTLPFIYNTLPYETLPAHDLYDITSGNNGQFSALPGYDEVTGRGTPMANLVAPNFVPRAIDPTSLQSSIVASQVAQTGNLNEQDLFTVGSDGLVREDRYFDSNHQSTGPVVIDPTTTFNAGTKLSVYSDGSSLNVFAVGSDGKLRWAQYTSNGGWTPFVTLDSLIGGSNITFSAGAALAGYASSGNFDLFAVASDGYLRQYAYYISSHSWQSYSFGTQVSFGAGTPVSVWDNGSHVDIFAVLPNGTLEQYQFVSGWVATNHGSDGQAPPQAPLAIWESGSSFTDLYAVNSGGNVDEIYSNDGTTWHGGNVISVSATGTTLHAAQGLAIQEFSDGGVELFGIGNDGNIVQVQKSSGTWGAYLSYGGFSTTSQATEYAVTSPSFVMQVFAIATTGHVEDAEYNTSSGWNEYDLSAAINPTTLQSSLIASQVAQSGNLTEQDLFVVGSDGLVREDRYYYGTHTVTGQVVIDPVTKFNTGTKLTVYSDGSSLNVFAVGIDGKLRWAQYTSSGGWTPFVTLDSLIPGSNITFAAGAALAGYASNGNFDLFAVGSDGYLRQYAYYISSHSWQSYSFGTQVSFGAGTPVSVWDNGSHVDIFAVLPNGTLQQYQFVSGWVASNHGSDGQAPPQAPLAIWESGSFTDLYAVNSGGNVDEIYSNDGTTWHGGNVISVSATGTTLVAAQELAIQEFSDGGVELFGVGNDGNIIQIQKSSGTWGAYLSYGGFATTSQATEYATTSPSFVMQVFVLAPSGDIDEAEFNGSWAEYDLG